MKQKPLISIIIPARNEAAYLPRCLAAIHSAAKKLTVPIEIILVNNRSTDNTEQIARDAGCLVVHNSTKNLSMIRNAGARAAHGRYLITIDADSYMSSNLLLEIKKRLDDPGIIGGGVMIYPERWSAGIMAFILCLIPLAVYHRISAGVFFSRRHDFFAINGFDEELCSAEDVDFAIRLRRHGRACRKKFTTIFNAHIITSTRKFDALGDWFFVKNPLRGLRLLKGKSQDEANTIWYDIER